MSEDIDMSKPGNELFPAEEYNSYLDEQGVKMDQAAEDPLDMGVKQDAASPVSDKEMNFKKLREEVSKTIQEREYWKGQAEAFSRQGSRNTEAVEESKSPFTDIVDDDVKTAFESIRQENQRLKQEMYDKIAAIEAKSQHSDWTNIVTQHVPELTNSNPIFAEMIRGSSNPYEAAYQLAQLNARASKMPEVDNGSRAVQNSQKPRSVSTVGGHSQLNAADYYARMSDAEFEKIAAKNLAGI